MSEWWTYTLSDFLLFSPRVYERLFELHNEALWPAQVLTVALGLFVLFMLLAPMRGRARIVPAILGVLWVWVAWAFFWERYATINWASAYIAPAWALEGLLLVLAGGIGGTLSFPHARGFSYFFTFALLAMAIVGYTVIAALMQKPLAAAEIFGIAPDPTAVATLAVLALAQGRMRWPLMVLPLLWSIVTGATLWTMGSSEFFVAPAGAAVAVALAIGRRSRHS